MPHMSKRTGSTARIKRRGPIEKRRAKAKGKRPQPVTQKPPDTQFVEDMSLSLCAFVLGKAIGVPLTPQKISGAIRGAGLKDVRVKKTFVYDGLYIQRQQTVVHHSQLLKLQEYLEGRWA